MARRTGIRQVTRADGSKAYEVRYRDGERHRGRTFDRHSDAERFHTDLRRRAQLGELFDDGHGDATLREFVVGPWLEDFAVHHLRDRTAESYVDLLDRHVLPRIGDLRMRHATPQVFDRLVSDLAKDGVGKPTIRRAMFVLQGVYRQAEIWEYVTRNPVKAIRKPKQKRVSDITVHPPARVERIRADLLAAGRRADALLVCLMAYAGLRPGEALGLEWRHIRERTILVEAAVALGEMDDTKTGADRSVKLLDPLAVDLAAYRAEGRPSAETALLFPSRDGRVWTDAQYRNWRKRIFRPAAQRAGILRPRPYDLRHSFVTLLVYSGLVLPEIAGQAGHGPDVCASTYVHVFADFDPRHPVDPAEAIERSRAGVDRHPA